MEQIDNTAFFKIGYGLYVITMSENGKDNGMICNTVNQVANDPTRLAVAINRHNYSDEVIRRTGTMNVNVISTSAPFSLFQNFGFRSGRDNDKFAGVPFTRSLNGLPVLATDCNAFLSLSVDSYIDLGTHTLFICRVTESKTISAAETMTYSYYQDNVKPQPPKKKGYVCKICGYVYEGDELPADFICPLCKHPASDFERIEEGKALPERPSVASAASVSNEKSSNTQENGKMKKYICEICGYVYDPANGDPEHGIAAGTAFEDIPDDWVCPFCGMTKASFKPMD